jgi:hypothetical protein
VAYLQSFRTALVNLNTFTSGAATGKNPRQQALRLTGLCNNHRAVLVACQKATVTNQWPAMLLPPAGTQPSGTLLLGPWILILHSPRLHGSGCQVEGAPGGCCA